MRSKTMLCTFAPTGLGCNFAVNEINEGNIVAGMQSASIAKDDDCSRSCKC